MSLRKVIFWFHLVAGVVAGLAIAIMCFTGVALAFKKQLVAWSERDARLVAPPALAAARLPLEEMTRRVHDANPGARPASITIVADPRATVAFTLGRDRTLYVNPYTGEVLTPASTRLRDFMRAMEDWHRWLALPGDLRPIGKLVNGVGNAAFLALAVTGLYLWLPRTWSWRGIRAVALLNARLAGKARDFNWHNAIGLWSAPVLIVLTLTALPMSFHWANALVYQLAGETPPVQQGPGGPLAGPAVDLPKPPDGAHPLGRDALLAVVQEEFPAWEQITLRTGGPGRGGPAPAAAATRPSEEPRRAPQPLTFTVKQPGGWPRTATTTVIVNPFTGDILRRENFADRSTGRRWRLWTRFLHTGEALGVGGQLLAGLASLGGCFLVYTGFALSWRRFFGKRNAPPFENPGAITPSAEAPSAPTVKTATRKVSYII